MLRLFLLLPLMALLIGCVSPSGLVFRDSVVQKGAEAYDESVANAETWNCRVASVGSIVRKYGNSPEMWDAWLTICGYKRPSTLQRPENLEELLNAS